MDRVLIGGVRESSGRAQTIAPGTIANPHPHLT
jgi:hypothetical protein